MSTLAQLVAWKTRPPRHAVALAITLLITVGCTDQEITPTGPGVLVRNVALPVAGAAYHGGDPHLFLGGAVSLFCGSHGTFSGSQDPPAQAGQTVVTRYTATFQGELTLAPPAVSSPATHTLDIQVTMAENITLRETSNEVRTFDTELVTFELQGAGAIADVMVRESPDVVSAGVTTITAVSDGQSRVETHYDVWLDISLDGGRSWNRAESPVRMTLEPS